MRVLYLTHRLPYAPNRGDRIRAFHTLRALREYAAVDLVTLTHDDSEAAHVPELHALTSTVRIAPTRRWHKWRRAAATLLTNRPLTHALLDSPRVRRQIENAVAANPPDVVLAFCSGMARFALEPPLSNHPVVIDMVDVDSAKWRALARTYPVLDPRGLIYRREARVLRQFELESTARAFATLVINSREQSELAAAGAAGRIEIVGNGVDTVALTPRVPPAQSSAVVLCGVMDYEPNESAALWVLASVWPSVLARVPDATLWIVGANPTDRLRAASAPFASVHVTGSVPEVAPYLWKAAVSIAPMFMSRGMQNKVVEAVAAGLPVVVTPQVMAGLPVQVRPACTEASDAASFSQAILHLLDASPAARRQMAGQADLEKLTWENCLQPLKGILVAAAAQRRSHHHATGRQAASAGPDTPGRDDRTSSS